ncbi:ras-related protein rab-32 [Lasius niger]|uniref:Ras-related protein rab-32 n=1 Tax=Lasius niger TaxID=67767 RepID=A0A0J7KUZ2_LASNI|nr:ras-related protein rab-32 [Lasius niger]
MAHNESTNEGGSSPDTVIARFSSDEEKQKPIAGGTSGEYVTAGDSNSSLDTLTSSSGGVATLFSNVSADDRKKGKFGAFKSSFREGGIFKIKKKPRETDASCEADTEQDDKASLRKLEIGDDPKEISRQQSQQLEESKSASAILKKKKKKKSHSLVRKLSLNKFRLSSEQQETRHTPEGGDSSRSQSQSPQESPVHPNEPIKKQGDDNVPEREKGAKGELKKPEKLLEKPSKTVTIVQHTTPSVIIKSFVQQVVKHCSNIVIVKNLFKIAGKAHDNRLVNDNRKFPLKFLAYTDTAQHPQQEKQDKVSRSDVQCCSTLPYALSSWPERSELRLAEDAANIRTGKTRARSDPDSSNLRVTTESSPVEVRRKLSLLEEKRAIFQRRFFDSSYEDTRSNDAVTISSLTIDDEPPSTADNEFLEQREEDRKKRRARQICVKTFDVFSTFESALDEEAGLGYLGSIEEDNTESYGDNMDDHLGKSHSATVGAVAGQSSSNNNASNFGVDEKREHLYKILVIGELGAGKTSIIKRYVHQFFSQHYRATIGVDFALKVLNWDPHTIIRLQLWDIAGQERFGNMTRVYYKEAVGAFIVFDVTRSATLDAVVKWKQDLDSKVQLPDGSSIPCVLLANKCDQQMEGLVNSSTKMDEYCKEKNFSGWFETSAKENINIEEAAKFLVNKCALKMENSCSALRRKSLAEELLRDLGLYECIDTLISKLSGGERKRLSLATELVTKPKIFFLDEPTTGENVESYRFIKKSNYIEYRAILNPGMMIYNTFSHVLLMADGRSIYFGTLENATVFFERKSGWFVQFYWLLWRILLRDKRTVSDNWIAWFSFSLCVIFVGIFYIGANSSTQEGIQTVRGALYMMMSEIIFTVAYSVIYELPGELVLYLRESTVYTPGPYYLATILGSTPKAIFKALLFTVVIYLLLHPEFRLLDLFLYCLSTTATAICAIAYGTMTSSWITNIDIVTAIMVPLDLLLLLMAGMFYNLRTLPSYLAYVKYTSIFYYATEAVSIIHWSGIKDIDCPVNRDLPCLSNGTEVLSEYGYKEGNFWWDMTGLLLLTILMNIVGYFGTKSRRATKSII